MGNKNSSISKTNIENKIINELDLKLYCETINETATNIANNIYLSHTANANITNEMNVGTISVSGKDSKANLLLSNKGSVKMTSEIITEIMNDVSSSIANQMVADVKEMIDTDLLNKITEEMNQNIENGMMSTAFGNKTENSQETTMKNEINNKTKLSFENIVKNITTYNMSNNIEEQCLSNTNVKNKMTADNILVSEGGELLFKLENEVDVKLDCISNIKLINRIASDLCNLSNIKIEEDKTTKNTTDLNKKNKQDVKNKGTGEVLESLGDGIGNVAEKTTDGLANMVEKTTSGVGNIFKSTTLIFFIIGCVVCIVLIVAIFGISYILTDETGSQSVQSIVNTAVSAAGPGGKLKMLTGKGYGNTLDESFKYYLKKLFNKNEL